MQSSWTHKGSSMNLEDIKERLEANNGFQHLRDEVGISWVDFEVLDLQTNTVLKQGSKEIGDYGIWVNGDKLSAFYDLTVDSLRDRRLDRARKVLKGEVA